MNTTADKLNKLIATKEAIKAAIEAKGVTDVGERFADYPEKIMQIGLSDIEVVNLTLTTNQVIHDALVGKVVHVKYANFDDKYTWDGETLRIEMSKNTPYSIEFPAVEGYRSPGNVSYTAVGGNTRNLTVSYDTEMLTVNVSCEVATVSLVGQKITINGKVYTTPDDYTIIVKIPFGENYDIVASARAGFETPDKLSFTASQATRGVSVIYTKISLGVFILGTDSNLYSANEWSKPNYYAVGVAVLTNNCKFVIAPDGRALSNWSVGSNALIAGVTATTDKSIAEKDYKGVQNTANIISKYGTSNTYAGKVCSSYTFRNGKNGYLGAAGEWKEVYNNKTEINACLSKIGGEQIGESPAWSSTQYNKDSAWFMNNGNLEHRQKTAPLALVCAIPFAEW